MQTLKMHVKYILETHEAYVYCMFAYDFLPVSLADS
jgi:hypothetical protein